MGLHAEQDITSSAPSFEGNGEGPPRSTVVGSRVSWNGQITVLMRTPVQSNVGSALTAAGRTVRTSHFGVVLLGRAATRWTGEAAHDGPRAGRWLLPATGWPSVGVPFVPPTYTAAAQRRFPGSRVVGDDVRKRSGI